MDDLIELWQAHNAIDLYLLDNLPEGGLEAVPASGGWHVGQIFAHINDLRLRWVHGAAPELAEQIPWFEKQPQLVIDAAQLRRALESSGRAVDSLIRQCSQAGRGVDGFPGSLASFLGYLISHESYHWGEIGLALTQSNRPLHPDVAFGIWKGWWGREVAPKNS